MSNPFQFFAGDDDDEKYQPVATEQKAKRTHQEKRLYKQQQTTTQKSSEPVITEPLPEKHKENAKQIRNPRHPPTPVTKKLGEGHFLDRRSGTGRVDRPRKEGGGKGNVGNIKDDLNQDKYIKQTPEEPQPQAEAPVEEVPEETKPEEPQALTLEEYYKNKGIELNNNFQQRAPARRADINAEWIKKEKLTVLETKQDKKNSERNTQGAVKFSSARVGLDENLGGLGFGQKPSKKAEERREVKNEPRGGKGKKERVVINDDDFPTL